jgi:hypothetical protein
VAKLFEYVVIYHPKKKKLEGEEVQEKSKIIVDLKRDLASTDKEVAIRAAREIPEEYLDKLDQVEIAIRPF